VGSAIFVGDESDVGAIVVPVVVPDIVEGDRRGYRLPSGHHRHYTGMVAATGGLATAFRRLQRRQRSGGSSGAGRV